MDPHPNDGLGEPGVAPKVFIRRKGALTALVAFVLGCSALSACGTLDRPSEAFRPEPGLLIRVQDPRIEVDDRERMAALLAEFADRIEGATQSQSVLALSGGGANGAYGAGVVVGWTERGDRPTFDIVTGVSTGALTAPFAFLGPSWDDQLREAYTSGQCENLLSRRNVALLGQPSLFSSRGLHGLVNSYVTPEMLAAIAAEHARGRRLLVATTNLDTQETVIWDMGVLAAQGGDEALALFREVLVASASIPGVFPPVLISGLNDEGLIETDMHVDGGVNTPFLAIPEELLLWTSPTPRADNSRIYVVVNGRAGRAPETTAGNISGILARSYDSMSVASLRVHLAATAAFATRNGLTLRVLAIPEDVEATSLSFDRASMQLLFELGRSRVIADAWAPLATGRRPAASPVPFANPDPAPNGEAEAP